MTTIQLDALTDDDLDSENKALGFATTPYKQCGPNNKHGCGEWKRIDEFHKDKRGRFGVQSICKACKRVVNASINPITNGNKTPTYRSWKAMIQRCTNPNAINYANYGGRGVTVAPEWRSFQQFLADMGERPEGTSLDRIDVNSGYGPGLCRWATRKEQAQNRRPRRKKEDLEKAA